MPGPRPKYAIMLTPEPEARLQQLSTGYMAPFATVQRAQSMLLAQYHPEWSKAVMAQQLKGPRNTVKRWRQRWQTTDSLSDAPRAGTRRTCTPLPRAQVMALACRVPRQSGKPGQRWAGEKLAQVASEPQSGERIAPGTMRTGLRADQLKPWRYPSWQHSPEPQFSENATPVLDLDAQAPARQGQGELAVWVDEKTSLHARQRVTAPKAATPGEGVQVADRYKRRGALQLFGALVVASGLTFAQTRTSQKFVDFTAVLRAFFQSALWVGSKVVHLILDNGPTPAPTQLGAWLASLELSCEVRLYWLPTYARWLDQGESIFSKVQRDVLTPNDFQSTQALEKTLQTYFADLNRHPKPIHWTYTKTKLLAKFAAPPSLQLAA